MQKVTFISRPPKKLRQGLSVYALSVALMLLFCMPAFAQQHLVIHYSPEQVYIPKTAEPALQETTKNMGLFVITANKYHDHEAEKKYCLPRKFSLIRALKLREYMIKNGVRLEQIKIIVTTNRNEENDIATIDVHKSA